jgi:hypothetical protein
MLSADYPFGSPTLKKKLLVRRIPRANRRRVQRFLDLVEQSGREWSSYGVAPGSNRPWRPGSAPGGRRRRRPLLALLAVATAVAGVAGGRRLRASATTS